jgi:hypothetical protein
MTRRVKTNTSKTPKVHQKKAIYAQERRQALSLAPGNQRNTMAKRNREKKFQTPE